MVDFEVFVFECFVLCFLVKLKELYTKFRLLDFLKTNFAIYRIV